MDNMGLVVLAAVFVVAFFAGSWLRNALRFSRYQRKNSLITKTEMKSFYRLEPHVAEMGWRIFAQVRIADVISVTGKQNAEWWRAFRMISSKHIDFVVVDRSFNILFGIEIDDASHKRPDRAKRDQFVDKVFLKAGLALFRCSPGKEDDVIEKMKNFRRGV